MHSQHFLLGCVKDLGAPSPSVAGPERIPINISQLVHFLFQNEDIVVNSCHDNSKDATSSAEAPERQEWGLQRPERGQAKKCCGTSSGD